MSVVPGMLMAMTTDTTADHDSRLTEQQLEILAFERQWWKYAGAKESAVRERFAMSSTRYYQVLNALLDHPAALMADPMLVGRLRRLQAARRRQRTPQSLSMGERPL